MSIRKVTVNDVLLDIFPKAWLRINEALENKEHVILGVFPPQECRKSSTSDRWAVDLAKQGKNVMIAVPSGDIAREHEVRIQSLGGDAHILRSHEAAFKGKTDDCPEYDNIQYLYNLGVDSQIYKKKYCKNCPYYESCSYPRQYSEALEEENRIVIIQHAHFRCRETLFQILANKHFDVLIIDESFIDSLIDVIKPTEFEITALRILNVKWARNLSSWLESGGEPKGNIKASQEDLEALFQMFEDNNEPWRLKSLIDAYNRGEYYDTRSGIKVFAPIPKIPVTVITDATPDEDELKSVFNVPHIEFFGRGCVLDIQHYHPENEIIQVIDSSLSKSSLKKDEKFYEFLNYIGYKCTYEFKQDRVLVTTFKDKDDFPWTQETIDYLRTKFPHLDVGTDPQLNRIVVDGMKVGVNTYAGFTIQFLVCSVYMSGYQIAESAYRSRLIVNYWRGQEGLPYIQNIVPREGQSVSCVPIPVRKIEPDGVYEYPDIQLMVPEEKYNRMAYNKNLGKSQQAVRIRFTSNPENRKKVYIFGNYNLPSMLITKTVLFDDILAELN